MPRWAHFAFILALTLSTDPYSPAQSKPCQAPVLRPLPAGTDLFNEKQEMELAATFHHRLEQDMKLIEDESLTGELQRVGDRLAASFPPTGLKFRYYIYDAPEENAFAVAGGRIYFSRKLIAFFRSEDELASVMAHEMGHIVTHQSAIEISRQMKAVLGITQLSETDDIEDKYNELLDNYKKKPSAFKRRDREDHQQIDADQVAVFAAAAAGYDVKSPASVWDRFNENKGKKGNFLTDLFGGTTEEQRRFRDMLKNSAALAPECIGKHPETTSADFKKWQNAVLAYDGIGHREKLDGMIARKPLTPPLRPELTHLRISPDGKFAIAEDSGSVAVLNREDLKSLFRIDVSEARSVHFTPDSKAVALYSMDLFTSPRVEIWDIADHALRAAYELHFPNGCNQAALSPDASYFACVTPESELSFYNAIMFDLRIVNTDTGEMTYEKKKLFSGDLYSTWFHTLMSALSRDELQVVSMHFSPDSKYLLVGRQDLAMAVEAATGAKLNLPGTIKDIMHEDFDFLDGDRIAGGSGSKGDKGAVVKFPTGEVVYSNLKMGLEHVQAAAKGDYLVMYPLKDYAAGVFDIKRNTFFVGSKKRAIDIYGEEYLLERKDGELARVDISNGKDILKAPLEEGPIGNIVAENASDDLNYVAISGTARGAVWNLDKGTRVMHLRRFNGVGVDDKGFTVADFPVEGESKRQFAQIDTASGKATSFPAEEDWMHYQHGAYLVEWIPAKKGEWKKNVTCNVKSMRSNLVLWTRAFPNGAPKYFISDDVDSMVLAYDVDDPDGKLEMQVNDELRAKVQALKTREHAYAIESLDLKTGKIDGVAAIDTGKGAFQLRDAFRAGKNLVVADTSDRVQVYGFDGVRKGRMQSHGAAATKDGHLMAVSTGRGKLTIYDLDKFKQTDELDFISRIAMFRFSADGKRLLVVTRDQKAYYFDTTKLRGGDQVAAK
jgi:WD40 repeat protein